MLENTANTIVCYNIRTCSNNSPSITRPKSLPSNTTMIAQALEIARESPEGAEDATVNAILETAISHIWRKVELWPDSYIMTKHEFAIFNYFQHRFKTNRTAAAARKRYWDNAEA